MNAEPGESERLAGYLAVIGAARDGTAGPPELRGGQFHDVVLAGDVAYRFPRDDESRRLLPRRVALLRVLSESGFPVATPVPLTAGPASGPVGGGYAALSRLRGRSLPVPVRPQDEPAVLGELARLLDALGALGADPAVTAAVPGADPGYWARFASDAGEVLFPMMSGPGRQRARAELGQVLAVDPAGGALVHGDLGGTNLLWQAGPRLAGILDWDEAHLGNPAEDVASLAVTFGWPLAGRLSEGRPGPLMRDARAIAGTFALQQALPAARSGDSVMLADGLARYV